MEVNLSDCDTPKDDEPTQEWMADTYKNLVWRTDIQRIKHEPRVHMFLMGLQEMLDKIHHKLPKEKESE